MIFAALALLQSGPDVTFEDLLTEMTNRSSAAIYPEPYYTVRQASSYDRDSDNPDDAKTWYANWDRSQFIRTDEQDGRREYVMMDAKGPGAVVRLWGTWHGASGKPFSNGTLRVYLNGSSKPAIEGPITQLVSGGGLVPGPLSQFVSPTCPPGNRAHNLYLPIPYQSGCRITYETDAPMDAGARSGEALYYQINYREYAPNTTVETYSSTVLNSAKRQIEATVERLNTASLVNAPAPELAARQYLVQDKPVTVAEFKGPGAVSQIALRLDTQAQPGFMQAVGMRSTILKIEADGEQTVWCPVGDFFGSGYKLSPHWSWRTRVDSNGLMTANWVMPYQKSMKISLVNLGPNSVRLDSFKARTMPWEWNDRSMHFHAAWQQYTRVKTGVAKGMTGENAQDLNFVSLRGKGRYVGDSLTIFNGADAWWGEGDEKIYIDGETFPSHFGTGTEDYYGYAWCRPEPFSSPFHAQPSGEGNLTKGYSVNSRWRLLDDIPYEKSLKFDMELWHWAETQIDYAPTVFWYALPGGSSNIKPAPQSALITPAIDPEEYIPPYRVKGVLEAESMKVLSVSGGAYEKQSHSGVKWSNARQIWWMDAKPGDVMRIQLPVVETGRYKIDLGLTYANDYGRFRITLDGKELSGNVDLYSPTLKTEEKTFGTHQLYMDRPMILEVWCTGTNPAAQPRRMFGLDYVRLTPQ